MILFTEKGHKYASIKKEDKDIQWISATKFVSFFHDHFDADLQAAKCSANERSKWFGMNPKEIQAIWKKEGLRATDTGSMYHQDMERKYLAMETINLFGKDLKVFPPTYDKKGRKLAPVQQFEEGAYPEIMLYLKLNDKVGICGQSDFGAICNNVANISDHKTNKEMKMEGFRDFQSGISKKMHWPFQDLDDCDYFHYVIQLNFYLYIMLMNNPGFQPGSLVLRHVKFEVLSEDDFGFPTHRFVNNLPVVQDITKYNVPYLGEAVMTKALTHMIDNILNKAA